MKFPWLKAWNNAKCEVNITEMKPGEDGTYKTIRMYSGDCNYSEKALSIRSDDGQYNRLNATIKIEGDLCPEAPVFTGKVTVRDRVMSIEMVERPRNPDGSIHHTTLGLI